MDADQPESFVAHVPVPSQEEVSSNGAHVHVPSVCFATYHV